MTGIFSESRVLLVDDHPVFREGLKAIVDSHPKLRVVAEASSIGEALSKVRKYAIQVVVSDLSLADGSGQELLEKALAVNPSLRFVILSVSRLSSDVFAAIQGGALAYVTKGASREEVLHALDEVLRGRTFLHPDVSDAVVDRFKAHQSELPRLAEITPREQQVLEKICQGRTPKEIAADLNLGISTVKTHMRSLYRKMGVSTRTLLVLKALGPRPKA